MRQDLDISVLRTFVNVAHAGSMTMAAARLNLTQGAVSQQVRRLEETLQCTLLDRSRRALKLTPDGERLAGMARTLLRTNDEIWDAMTAPALQGELRLGLPDDLVSAYLPQILEAFVSAYPDIEISLVSGASPSLFTGIQNGTIDIALVEEGLDARAGERLSVERLHWVGAKGGKACRNRPLPLSMITETCAFHEPVIAALNDRGIAWRTVFENGSIDTTLTTVRMDLAVTVSLAAVVPADLEIIDAAESLPALPEVAVNLYLGDSESDPAIQKMALLLRDCFQRRRVTHNQI